MPQEMIVFLIEAIEHSDGVAKEADFLALAQALRVLAY
jgi:hypothetical protein